MFVSFLQFASALSWPKTFGQSFFVSFMGVKLSHSHIANRGKHSVGMLSPRDFMRWILQLLTAMPSDPDLWGLETAWPTCLGGPKVDDCWGLIGCLPRWKTTHIQNAVNAVSGIWVPNFGMHYTWELWKVRTWSNTFKNYSYIACDLCNFGCTMLYVIVRVRVVPLGTHIHRQIHAHDQAGWLNTCGRSVGWKVSDSAQAFHGDLTLRYVWAFQVDMMEFLLVGLLGLLRPTMPKLLPFACVVYWGYLIAQDAQPGGSLDKGRGIQWSCKTTLDKAVFIHSECCWPLRVLTLSFYLGWVASENVKPSWFQLLICWNGSRRAYRCMQLGDETHPS